MWKALDGDMNLNVILVENWIFLIFKEYFWDLFGKRRKVRRVRQVKAFLTGSKPYILLLDICVSKYIFPIFSFQSERDQRTLKTSIMKSFPKVQPFYPNNNIGKEIRVLKCLQIVG